MLGSLFISLKNLTSYTQLLIYMVADTPSMFVEMSFNILRGKFVKMDYIDENLVEC